MSATSAGRGLLGHPVQPRLCAPAAVVAVTSPGLVRLLSELRPATVPDVLAITVLVLSTVGVTALRDPAGSVADATPTSTRMRLAARAGPVLGLLAGGWAAVLATVPAARRPPPGALTSELVVLVLVVLAVGATEVRWRARSREPMAGAVGVAMAWASLWLLRPSWSPFARGEAGGAALAGVAVAAVLVLAVSSSDGPLLGRRARARQPGRGGRSRSSSRRAA